jgi:nitroreductase
MMEVHEAIRMKRAVRVFSSTPLAQENIDTILQAGRRAQSAKNTQPWHFVAIQDKDLLKALSNCGTYAGHLAGAALGVALLTPDPAQRWSIMFDAGQAAAYMQLAAWSLGIGSCLATIYETEEARQLLAIPADFFLHVAISFGYPADLDDLTRTPKVGGRKDLKELIHQETW